MWGASRRIKNICQQPPGQRLCKIWTLPAWIWQTRTIIENLGINHEKNVLHRLHCISEPGLQKSDLFPMVYLGLFKHLMDWIEGFPKKHARLQACDNTRKAVPPYPQSFVPKKAYLSQGHGMARKRDKEPWAVSFGGSRRSTAPVQQPASNTFQICSRLCPGTGWLQYDGAIPKPHPQDDSLHGGISRPGFTGWNLSPWSFKFLNEHGPRLTRSERSYNISEPRATRESQRPSGAGASKTSRMGGTTSI